MIIIGELINSTRNHIKKAIEEKDVSYIQDIAVKQVEKGADFVDVNAGALVSNEDECLVWLVETVQEVVNKPLSLDSSNPRVLKSALKYCRTTPMINSITAEKERYEQLIDLIKEYSTPVVALCMDDNGIPVTCENKLEVAERLLSKLDNDNIELNKVFLDPMIKPVSFNSEEGVQSLNAIEKIANVCPDVHITCGLSNISFGLPHRPLLNQVFLALAIGRGLDSVIADPLDKGIISTIRAAELLMGIDSYAKNYIKASRQGELS